jgi:serine/threonine-protein kinase
MQTDAALTLPRPEVSRDVFRPGEVLAEAYEIRRLLGAGGMGQVYEADDLLLRRRVAIKAHWREMQHLSIRKEAQALAAIRHPSIATVYGVGSHRSRDAVVEFVVMERIFGVTLAEHLSRRARDRRLTGIEEAIQLLALLADGLAAVHLAGVAHRDVKPANIMLAPGGRLVLMDFGIMLPEFAASPDAPMPGTAEYMAPEAIRRAVEPGRAFLLDVYAFGVVGHELLVGQRPFDSTATDRVLSKHLSATPPTLARLRPDVPEALEALISSCLAKDPHDRPQSMDAIATTLRRIRAEQARGQERGVRLSRPPLSALIVEDDPAFASVLAAIVQDACAGAQVSTVHDGEAALDHLRRGAPDLLLLDLGLPGMNGLELCMYLRGSKLAEATTIVSMSAAARAPDVALLRQLGIRQFVRKDGDLLERLEQIVGSLSR